MTIFSFNSYHFNKFEHFCRIFGDINYQDVLFVNIYISKELDDELYKSKIKVLFEPVAGNLIFNIIPQYLVDSAIALELISINETKNIEKSTYKNNQIIRRESDDYAIIGFNIDYSNENSSNESAKNAFLDFRFLKNHCSGNIGKLTRQWNYIGNINYTDGKLSNYNIFNYHRFSAYSQSFINDYPAATGIGAECTGLMVQGICIDSRYLTSISIENPEQIPAYNYSDNILYSNPAYRSMPPLFSRARLLLLNNIPIEMFISGTASINGETTISEQDIKMQTHKTIENIKKLISVDNLIDHLQNHCIEKRIINSKINYIRVYIKNADDYLLVKEIVEKELNNIPALYVQADVCRDNLLVEIEGFASIDALAD